MTTSWQKGSLWTKKKGFFRADERPCRRHRTVLGGGKGEEQNGGPFPRPPRKIVTEKRGLGECNLGGLAFCQNISRKLAAIGGKGRGT